MSDMSIQVYLRDLSILEALHRLPDEAALTPDEAAIFLRSSVTTLARMRKSENGPAYLQGGTKESRGTNQKVTYIKADLIVYQQGIKVSNSLSAAVRRGQTFIPYGDPTPKHSLYDLSNKRPFYCDKKKIEGCVIEMPFLAILARLGKSEIVWLNPIHAATLSWSNDEAKSSYVSGVRLTLQHALELIQ